MVPNQKLFDRSIGLTAVALMVYDIYHDPPLGGRIGGRNRYIYIWPPRGLLGVSEAGNRGKPPGNTPYLKGNHNLEGEFLAIFDPQFGLPRLSRISGRVSFLDSK